jgi:HD-GYP domain-containing protein (c-di-GMP phosphodiesterase class II)
VRVLTVVLSTLAAIALGLWAYASGSLPLAAAAVLFAVITVIVASAGSRHHAVEAAAQPPTVSPTQASPSPSEEPPVASPAEASAGPDVQDETQSNALVEDAADTSGVSAMSDDTVAEAPPASRSGAEEIPQDVSYATAGAAQPLAGPVDAAGAPAEPDLPDVRTPYAVQPAVVLMSLYDAAAQRYDTVAAHLWLQDASTQTLRLVAAFGPRVPSSAPVPMSDPILGSTARTGAATFASLHMPAAHDASAMLWRYAVPVGTPEMRGVAAVDVASRDDEPSAFVLNEVSAVLRGSLTASLAIHVARSEMETAVHLLKAAQELASGIGREELLATVLQRAMLVADATTGSVMLPDPVTGALRIVASKGLPSDIVATAEVAKGEGIAGVVYSSASPLLVEDLPGGPGAHRHGVISSASIPIADTKGSLGVINVGSRVFPARLTDAYLRALGILGSQTALAMRNADEAERSWDLYLDNLQALACALEANDPFRKDSSRRTALLSVALGSALGLDADDLVSLRIAAILHDVGMGLATGSVGSTDRPLSTVDLGLVRSHPKAASDVMASVPSLEHLAPMVRHHHERYDGAGYDTGLAGDAIPLGSRILAVVDAFVSMTSQRPYRHALDPQDAVDELAAMAGSQFDPAVVEAFRQLLEEMPGLALQV